MSKAVLASIRPMWCINISQKEKVVEVRKTAPKMQPPFKVYIYCTGKKIVLPEYATPPIAVRFANDNWLGKVIGEFTCDKVEEFRTDSLKDREQTVRISRDSCISMDELFKYGASRPSLYGWHISDLKIYEDTRPLSDFTPACEFMNDDGTCQHQKVGCSYQQADYNPDDSLNLVECGRRMHRPPQSWCYVEEVA